MSDRAYIDRSNGIIHVDTGNHNPVPIVDGETQRGGGLCVSSMAAIEVLHQLTITPYRDAMRYGGRFAVVLLHCLGRPGGEMTGEEVRAWLSAERERCRKLGIRFDGEQDNPRGGRLQCYTCLVTGSSFCVTNDNDIPARLEAMRQQFAIAQRERGVA